MHTGKQCNLKMPKMIQEATSILNMDLKTATERKYQSCFPFYNFFPSTKHSSDTNTNIWEEGKTEGIVPRLSSG